MFSSDCVWQIWSAISSIVGWINGYMVVTVSSRLENYTAFFVTKE